MLRFIFNLLNKVGDTLELERQAFDDPHAFLPDHEK